MSYQNVGTPRFYVNVLEWIDSLGISMGTSMRDHYRTLPVTPTPFTAAQLASQLYSMPFNLGNKCFIAILGHDLGTLSAGPGWWDIHYWVSPEYWNLVFDLVNGHDNIPYNGFSLSIFDGTAIETFQLDLGDVGNPTYYIPPANIGSIVFGTYYDMKNAPNLSLTMSREYGGTNEFTTYNGSSMSNTMWNKPPKWGNLGAWELGGGNPSLAKSGRRSWDLEFSFIDDGDLWGPNQMLSTDTLINEISGTTFDPTTDLQDDGSFTYNLLTDDNFFSQVWHKTLGGTLPFIFQPDKDNNNPDQFAICKFKNNSLKATQSAFNVYDISLSIEEVW